MAHAGGLLRSRGKPAGLLLLLVGCLPRAPRALAPRRIRCMGPASPRDVAACVARPANRADARRRADPRADDRQGSDAYVLVRCAARHRHRGWIAATGHSFASSPTASTVRSPSTRAAVGCRIVKALSYLA